MSTKIPAIPEPQANPESLRQTALSTKSAIEVLAGTRGGKTNAAVTWQDLVDLRLITVARIPK